MNDRTEDRLRSAFQAKAEQVTPSPRSWQEPPGDDRLGTARAPMTTVQARHGRARGRVTGWLPATLASGATVLVAVAAVAIATHTHSAGPGVAAAPAQASPASSALQLWSGFPVDATPRPLVLVGPAVLDPAAGFPTADAKEAFSARRVAAAVPLSSTPATADGTQLISAADAFTVLLGLGDGSTGPVTLRVTAARLDEATFSTDRGERSLPAWAFTIAGISDPVQVLAVPAADRWPHNGQPAGGDGQQSAVLSSDGRHLTFSFWGDPAGPGPCGVDYTASSAESRTAVSVAVHQVAASQPGSSVACAAIGQLRTVTVTLDAPLGNRVVLDTAGDALQVT